MTTNTARLLNNERRYGLVGKWMLLAAGVISYVLRPSQGQGAVVAVYSLITVAATAWVLTQHEATLASGRAGLLFWLSHLADVAYVTALIATSSGLSSPLYLLYLLLALKSLLYVPDEGAMIWVPFAFGPLYVLALWVAQGSLAFLADPQFLARYGLLLGVTVAITLAVWALSNRLQEVDRLRAALDARTADLASQTQALQRTATDLGDRVLELRSLQEVAKALSATLYLNQTLQTTVERLSALADSPQCAVAMLEEGTGQPLLTRVALAGNVPAPFSLPRLLAEDEPWYKALHSGRTQILNRDGPPCALSPLISVWQVPALEVTPMTVRGRPIGALVLGWHPGRTSQTLPRSLLESFAYFAATAVENARLYGEVMDKSQELEAVLSGIGDGVLVADTAGALALMNPVAARILALDEGMVGGRVRASLPSPELIALLEETSRGGQAQIRELSLATAGRSSDGQPRTFQALAAPVYRATETGKHVSGVVTVLRDITAQKELERMKSNFLSVVSHELKTPLHSIKGFVDIILMGKTGPVTELQRDFLGTVQEQTGHLQRLIEDLLEFSRLESGQVKLRPTEVALAELGATVVAKLSPLAASKPLQLDMLLAADFPIIEADPMRVEQVLTNLIENAIKFTPAGGAVRVLGWDRGSMVEIAVADTGIGVPPAERERVFERFYQVDSSARRRYKGTGLGLTICKHIVTQHGGHIWVEDLHQSSLERRMNGAEGSDLPGCEFHFTLPKIFVPSQQGGMALDFGALQDATVEVRPV